MDNKIRCQSCGMPLGDGFYGTNKDRSKNEEYCTFCFQNGDYTNPHETLETMIQKSIDNMTKDLSMSEAKAKELAHTFIPSLKRWKLNP